MIKIIFQVYTSISYSVALVSHWAELWLSQCNLWHNENQRFYAFGKGFVGLTDDLKHSSGEVIADSPVIHESDGLVFGQFVELGQGVKSREGSVTTNWVSIVSYWMVQEIKDCIRGQVFEIILTIVIALVWLSFTDLITTSSSKDWSLEIFLRMIDII